MCFEKPLHEMCFEKSFSKYEMRLSKNFLKCILLYFFFNSLSLLNILTFLLSLQLREVMFKSFFYYCGGAGSNRLIGRTQFE